LVRGYYVSVGQIYLLDNPLPSDPLTREHIKPRARHSGPVAGAVGEIGRAYAKSIDRLGLDHDIARTSVIKGTLSRNAPASRSDKTSNREPESTGAATQS
jgi:hypothetical protein